MNNSYPTKVYTYGLNDNGNLATGVYDEFILYPREALGLPDDVTTIFFGGMHSLFLTSNGILYGVGNNTEGELRNAAAYDTVSRPIKLAVKNALDKIRQSPDPTIAISRDGKTIEYINLKEQSTK